MHDVDELCMLFAWRPEATVGRNRQASLWGSILQCAQVFLTKVGIFEVVDTPIDRDVIYLGGGPNLATSRGRGCSDDMVVKAPASSE